MQPRSISALVLVLVLAVSPPALAAGSASEASLTAARPATTGPALYYTIHVTISDSKITLSRQDLPRTYSARFDIKNVGTHPHSFTLGPKLNGRATVVSRVVNAKSHAVAYFVQNDQRGVLRYYSSVAADRSKRGMQGVFTIS